jgi:hypothetical protein
MCKCLCNNLSHISHFFGYIPRNGIAGSYGKSMFSFLRSLHIGFHNGCTSLHSHQQCMLGPFLPYYLQHLLLLVFLMVAILTGVKWNFSVALVYISFMARYGEHFFMCFLAIWISSFEKVLFSSVVHFFTESLILGEFSFLSSLYILSLVWCIAGKDFLHSVGGLCNLETMSFVV